MATPSHCRGAGRSCMNSVAIRIVHSGLLARIGPAIDIGKCLRANEAKIHELPATTAFSDSNPCVAPEIASTLNISNGITLLAARDSISRGSQIRAEVSTLKNRTGGTALLRTETFLAIS